MPHNDLVHNSGVLQESGDGGGFSESQTDDQAAENKKSLAKKWQGKIEDARRSMGDFQKNIDSYRKYVRGEQHDDHKKGLIRANLIHAHIKRSVNQTYARNPQFSIRPTEQVSPQAIKKMRLFGKTAEIVLNRMFDDAKLKRRAKACLRAAKTTGIGWVKVFYSTNIQSDPIMQSRTKDVQDRIEQIDKLKAQLSDPEEIANKDRIKLELEDSQKSLAMESEQITYEGLVIDVLDSKNLIIDVTTIKDFDDYTKAPFLVEEIMMTKAQVMKRWKTVPAGTKEFKVGDKVKARIINISQDGKINLSLKKDKTPTNKFESKNFKFSDFEQKLKNFLKKNQEKQNDLKKNIETKQTKGQRK